MHRTVEQSKEPRQVRLCFVIFLLWIPFFPRNTLPFLQMLPSSEGLMMYFCHNNISVPRQEKERRKRVRSFQYLSFLFIFYSWDLKYRGKDSCMRMKKVAHSCAALCPEKREWIGGTHCRLPKSFIWPPNIWVHTSSNKFNSLSTWRTKPKVLSNGHIQLQASNTWLMDIVTHYIQLWILLPDTCKQTDKGSALYTHPHFHTHICIHPTISGNRNMNADGGLSNMYLNL